METTIQNLLNQVAAISKKYEEIAKITGENFNVFNVLGLTTKEVRTHSAFIGELLNSKGSHEQGNVFLKLFIEQIKSNFNQNSTQFKVLSEFDFENAKTHVEYYTGIIDENYENGGRIDILIKSGLSNIIIENKINAEDQYNQLIRYSNFSKNSPIFYLTLFGTEPSKDSVGRLVKGNDYCCLSYQSDILKWLELCKKEAVNFPILRETISQYIYLIKQLTNQTTNDAMSAEVIKAVIISEANYKAAQEIVKANYSVNNELLQKLKSELNSISEKLKLGFEFTLTQDGKYTSFRFTSDQMKKNNIQLTFECESKLNFFYFGFHWIDPKVIPANLNPEHLRSGFEVFGKLEFNHDWFCWTNWTQHYGWTEKEFIQILNGSFAVELEELIEKLITFIESKFK